MKRFAFYGRVSTEDQQDPESSKAWQLARATQLISSEGQVVVEYFDIGQSRSLPWKRRPEAARLLADHDGVELWVPEVGGAVDPGSDAHDLVMALYGGMSKGERNRIKIRVRSAMASQAAEGRFLGGRPPYGYRLADGGPHPNPGKAANGQRLHYLEPDPATAPIVERIFAEYLAGSGIYAIAEGLTRDGVPCPSAADPKRNSHRSGIAWSKGAVRAILRNPRYTGREV
jgi:site-specific DNA recombinase